MKIFKFSKIILSMILAFTFAFSSTVVFAKTYSDVPTSHWAYNQIDYVTDKGYMAGNTEGIFDVNAKIDPFEMSKTLARVAGYRDSANATDTERQVQEQIYNRFKTFLSQYNAFSLWNSTANREIAFLLEKGVLTDADLNHFVVRTQEGYEKIIYPSRESLSQYLVKALGREVEATSLTSYDRFNDDASIADSKKPYVYYLRKTGVISGDTLNNFNPNDNVTKAAFATILYNVDIKINGVTIDNNDNNTNNNSNNNNNNNNSNNNQSVDVVVTVVSGDLVEVNPKFNTLRIMHEDGKQKSYVLKSNANVYVNNQVSSIQDLDTTMTVSCVVENGTTVSTLRATKPINNNNNSNNNNNWNNNNNSNNNNNWNNNNNNSNNNVVDNNDDDTFNPVDLETVNGSIVSHMSGPNIPVEGIVVQTTTIKSNGDVVTKDESYRVASSAYITHNGVKTSLSKLNPEDRVTLKVSNGVAYSINSTSRFNLVKGTLVGKKYESVYDYYFTILPKGASEPEDYRLAEGTKYTRNDEEGVFYNDIRIGDKVELYLDLDEIIYIVAESTDEDDVEGIIKEITINEHFGIVTLVESETNETNTYTIQHRDYDVYKLKVGTRVTLELDSKEVVDVDIESQVAKVPVTGIIDRADSDEIVLRTISGYTTIETSFADTIVVDSRTGMTSSTKNLKAGMNITAYWNDEDNYYASTIIIN